MKHNNIFKFLGSIAVLAASVALPSCVKDRNNGAPDFSTTTATVLIPEGGLSKFNSQTVPFPATETYDSLTFYINYAAKNVAPNDVVVTLAIDNAAIATYNAANSASTGITYIAFPDSTFSFTTTKVTVKAGQNYSAPVRVYFKPNKIDIATSYMLAISIKDASGTTISGNFGTIYYHFIGNPLAGNYTQTGSRTNYTTGTSWPTAPNAPLPAGGTDGTTAAGYTGTIFASPVDGKTVQLDMGNVPDAGTASGLAHYLITGNATFSAITFNQGPNFDLIYSNISRYVVSYVPPSTPAVPGKPAFHLVTKYNNTTGNAGADRIIDQTFVHQ